jgi:hypothetical protein
LTIPWNQLTHYEGPVHMSLTGSHVLVLAPNIVECFLLPSGTRSIELTSPLTHQLRKLRVLPSSTVELLTLPALEHLCFPTQAYLAPIEALMEQSAATLSHLEIHSFESVSDELLNVLAAASSVETLTFWGGRSLRRADASPAFDHLMHHSRGVLPSLKHLNMSGIVFDDSFVRMVESRCGASVGTHLETVNVADIGPTRHTHQFGLRKLALQHWVKVTILI